MAPSPPSWMNDNFLAEALRSERNDPSISVISSEIGPATAVGDNFASDMYRAILKFKRKDQIDEISLIIKILPTEGEMAKIIGESDAFTKETQYFTVIMPAQQALLDEAYPEKFQPFSAKYVYSTESPKSIVLEDLKKAGFKMAEVNLGLDLKHTLLVLKNIARFHATSLVLYHSNKECLNYFTTSNQWDSENVSMKTFLRTNVRCVAEEVEKWAEFKEKYCERLYSLAEPSMDIWTKCCTRDNKGFNVLIHGDLWLNNLMFKYSEETGDVEDVRFVDFQLSNWTSPAVDLHYFMNSSVSPDVLANRDMLMQEYHHTLCETLCRLGHKELQPTFKVLQDEVQERCKFGIIASIAVRILALKDKTKVPDMDKIIRNEGGIYLSDNYKQTFRDLLPLFDKWGWLNH